MNQGKYGMSGFGTQTAAMLLFQGSDLVTAINNTELWNGSSWTEVNEMNTARWYLTGAGISNFVQLLQRSNTISPSNNVETWNGSSGLKPSEGNTSRVLYSDGAEASSDNSAFVWRCNT